MIDAEIKVEAQARGSWKDPFERAHDPLGVLAVGRHIHVRNPVLAVRCKHDLSQICAQERLAAADEQVEDLSHRRQRAFELVEREVHVRRGIEFIPIKAVDAALVTARGHIERHKGRRDASPEAGRRLDP